MQKKGLSTIVASLLIVVLTFVAIGIIWVVIKNIISQGTEEISLGSVMTNLQVKDVKVNSEGTDVKIKREIGAGDISGIKIIISDGINNQIFDQRITLNELEEKTFLVNYSSVIKEVSVAPILKLPSGKEKIGNPTGKISFTNEEAVKNLRGLVSWWRFNGDTDDEIGGNNGILFGGVNCNAPGKYGKACSFDGNIGSYIDMGNDPSLTITNEITIIYWYNRSGGNARGPGYVEDRVSKRTNYVVAGGQEGAEMSGFFTDDDTPLVNQGIITTYYRDRYTGYMGWMGINTNNKWYNFAHTYSSNLRKGKVYLNSQEVGESSFGFHWLLPANQTYRNYSFMPTTTPLTISYPDGYILNGTIDEVMIFNRSLSAEEVKALYNLDLS